MVSLRFPFLFSQPSKLPAASSRSLSAAAVGCSLAAAAAAAAVISQNSSNPSFQDALNSLRSAILPSRNHLLPMWGCLSLSDSAAPVSESRTGMSFPSVLKDSQRLLGIGLRRKAILGLKNIDVYAFGVYADDDDIREVLGKKYGTLPVLELKDKKQLQEDLMESCIRMTVRLQIVYGRLSIKSVRSAFEESVGSRLQKFGGSDNKELLQRFTSQFKDEYKIPRGSVIELSREEGHVLRTAIDGKEVGCIQSKLLCRSILDLYIGDQPFDKKAKDDVELNLASMLQT